MKKKNNKNLITVFIDDNLNCSFKPISNSDKDKRVYRWKLEIFYNKKDKEWNVALPYFDYANIKSFHTTVALNKWLKEKWQELGGSKETSNENFYKEELNLNSWLTEVSAWRDAFGGRSPDEAKKDFANVIQDLKDCKSNKRRKAIEVIAKHIAKEESYIEKVQQKEKEITDSFYPVPECNLIQSNKIEDILLVDKSVPFLSNHLWGLFAIHFLKNLKVNYEEAKTSLAFLPKFL